MTKHMTLLDRGSGHVDREFHYRIHRSRFSLPLRRWPGRRYRRRRSLEDPELNFGKQATKRPGQFDKFRMWRSLVRAIVIAHDVRSLLASAHLRLTA